MNSLLRVLLLIGSIVYLTGCNQGTKLPSDTIVKEESIPPNNQENTVPPNNQKSTPPSDAFRQAVKEGTLQDVRHYIENEGIDVNARYKEGGTPLHDAVISNINVAKYLIEKGATVNAKDNRGWTPFHLVAIMIGLGDGD